jgi:uncharacterized delta-60 repeat protein
MKKLFAITGPCRLVLGLCLCATAAYGAAGSLDATFGKGGKVMTNFAYSVVPSAAALQPDGKIVVATGFDNTPAATESFGVVRYLPSGALDTTFGSRGSTMTSFTNFLNSPNALALQPDGKIVVVGTAQSADGTLSEFAIARFNANGLLDTTFGSGGKVTTNFVGVMLGGVSNPATAVLIQPDGKILVGGSTSRCYRCGTNTALARYNPNGSLDSTFGNNGMVSVQAIGQVRTLAEDAAGNIFALNGSAIAEFSRTGVLQAQVTPSAITVASQKGSEIFQADGRFLLAQGVRGITRHDTDVQVVRFNPAGSIDPLFNNPKFDFGGVDTVDSDFVQALALQTNSSVVAGGGHSTVGSTVFGMARLNPDGSLDPSFGNQGVLTTSFTGADMVVAVLIQTDGKIVAVGQTYNGSIQLESLVLARYLSK